jgi:hypothetical protein
MRTVTVALLRALPDVHPLEQPVHLGQIGFLSDPQLRPDSPRLSCVTTASLQSGDGFVLDDDVGFSLLNAFSHLGDKLQLSVPVDVVRHG